MSVRQLKSHLTFSGQTSFWEHDSTETRTPMKFSTFVPSGPIDGALIWLSGLTCSEENFITKAGAQRSLAQNRLMMICPDTSPRGLHLPHEHDSWDFGAGAGFYVDATTPGYRDHYRMFSYISKEVHTLLQNHFSIQANRISISGHSMGGHGALILGLKEPQKFRSVSAFSPIVNPVLSPWGQKAFRGYFGEDHAQWSAHDATELIRAGHRHPMPLRIDQGEKDEFLEKQLLTQHLVKEAIAAGQDIDVQFRAGYDHSYYFISTFIESHIAFHAASVRSEAAKSIG